jgi:hypothetical protein
MRERTLRSCLAEVRKEWPNLPRSKQRIAAKLFLMASQLEGVRDENGVEVVEDILNIAMEKTKERGE